VVIYPILGVWEIDDFVGRGWESEFCFVEELLLLSFVSPYGVVGVMQL